jgi:hypothetical protein
MTLAIQRNHDQGSLWGCIGMHGGLVGGWFLLTQGLLDLSEAPAFLVGYPAAQPNPLSGLIAITALGLLLHLAMAILYSASASQRDGGRNGDLKLCSIGMSSTNQPLPSSRSFHTISSPKL